MLTTTDLTEGRLTPAAGCPPPRPPARMGRPPAGHTASPAPWRPGTMEVGGVRRRRGSCRRPPIRHPPRSFVPPKQRIPRAEQQHTIIQRDGCNSSCDILQDFVKFCRFFGNNHFLKDGGRHPKSKSFCTLWPFLTSGFLCAIFTSCQPSNIWAIFFPSHFGPSFRIHQRFIFLQFSVCPISFKHIVDNLFQDIRFNHLLTPPHQADLTTLTPPPAILVLSHTPGPDWQI